MVRIHSRGASFLPCFSIGLPSTFRGIDSNSRCRSGRCGDGPSGLTSGIQKAFYRVAEVPRALALETSAPNQVKFGHPPSSRLTGRLLVVWHWPRGGCAGRLLLGRGAGPSLSVGTDRQAVGCSRDAERWRSRKRNLHRLRRPAGLDRGGHGHGGGRNSGAGQISRIEGRIGEIGPLQTSRDEARRLALIRTAIGPVERSVDQARAAEVHSLAGLLRHVDE